MEASTPADTARLEVSDAMGRRVVPLSEDVIRLGRANDNHVQVLDGRVSKQHAEILRRDGGHLLRDLDSRAGVYCNGDAVHEHRLQEGDLIQLGKTCPTRIVFRTGARSTGSMLLAGAFSDTNFARVPGVGARETGESASAMHGLQNLARFLDLSRSLSGHLAPDEVVDHVVDMAIEITDAERGFVVLSGDGDRLRFQAVREPGAIRSASGTPAISETIVRQVLTEKSPRVVNNVAMDPNLAAAQSVMDLQLGSVVALPLWRHVPLDADRRVQATDQVFGVLCLDSRRSRGSFDAIDLGILETLARDASAAIENARLLREAEEKQRMAEELRRAREVQEALVSGEYRPAPHFDIAGSYAPCLDLGGDFLGQFPRRDGECAFLVADVCGKGVQAALLAAALQGALLVELGTEHPLQQVVGRVNQVLSGITPLGRFISMLVCSLTPDGTLRYVNAGHCPLLLVRQDSVEELVTGGMALCFHDAATYQEHVVQLAPGDTAVLYTDGILEAMNRERELFGAERLRAAVAAAHGRPAQETCKAILDAVEEFCGDTSADDDTTLMVVTYRSPAAG